MLVELRLAGLGAIDTAELELGPGFTAVTGETGAGKTMLLSGLALLLGGRADSGLVREGHPRAEVEGRFRLNPDGPVATRVIDAGGQLDGDELIIARSVSSDGRSRAFLGGRSVPLSTLAELAEDLVSVHGQADQRGLLRPAVQRRVLDSYAGRPLTEPVADYHAAFGELAVVRAELEEVTSQHQQRLLEADGLRHGLAEVDRVAPVAGEADALRAESQRLGAATELRSAVATARELLATDAAVSGGPDVLGLLGSARQALEAVSGTDAELDALATRLAEAAYLLSDVSADLSSYLDRVEADPARLASVHERLAALAGLTRRYGEDIRAVLDWAATARERLLALDNDDTRVEALRARRDELLATLTELATTVSDQRRHAAHQLDTSVSRELAGLGMPDAALVTSVEQRADDHGLGLPQGRVAFGPWGVDDVAIQLAAHDGAPARPLHRGASGGELSRVMLAVEIVLAGADPVSSFVFDEVDAGVGGRAAIEVGRRLAALARSSQVLVVTHLPQVAAFADRHIVVTKSRQGLVTSSDVDLVDGETRLIELSRMLGGLDSSQLARGHAEELLATAQAAKVAS